MANYIKIEEETVDITNVSNWKFTSDFAKNMVLHPEKFRDTDKYPTQKLVDSIKSKGFIPNFPDTTYHGDVYPDFSKSMVLRWRNGTFTVPAGPHRLCATKLAGLKKIRCYVERPVDCSQEQINEFKNIMKFMDQYGSCKYQSWEFPGGLKFKGRDDISTIFLNFKLPPDIFAGRTVLDIACNTGQFAIKSGLLGATEIAGFDVVPECIKSANDIAKAYRFKCKYDFKTSEFWDYPFNKKYDIVFCNQSMYHFTSKHRSKCLGGISDMLDKITRVTGRVLLMYTFTDVRDPPSKDGGYYPTSSQLEQDLIKRGFAKATIDKIYGQKKHVIAIKKYKNIVN